MTTTRFTTSAHQSRSRHVGSDDIVCNASRVAQAGHIGLINSSRCTDDISDDRSVGADDSSRLLNCSLIRGATSDVVGLADNIGDYSGAPSICRDGNGLGLSDDTPRSNGTLRRVRDIAGHSGRHRVCVGIDGGHWLGDDSWNVVRASHAHSTTCWSGVISIICPFPTIAWATRKSGNEPIVALIGNSTKMLLSPFLTTYEEVRAKMMNLEIEIIFSMFEQVVIEVLSESGFNGKIF